MEGPVPAESPSSHSRLAGPAGTAPARTSAIIWWPCASNDSLLTRWAQQAVPIASRTRVRYHVLRGARVTAVTLQEGCLEVRVAAEVLGGQAGEVRQCGPHGRATQVDDTDDAVADEPIAGLPVPMGGCEGRGEAPATTRDLRSQQRHY